MFRLAIVTTHPIQYYAPWFAMLNQKVDVDVHVFYTWSQAQSGLFDQGFKQQVTWDIPLLEGYDYSFVPNESAKPGIDHFKGLVNPELIPAIERWQADGVLVIGWNYRSHLRVMRHFKGKIPVFFRGDSHLLDEKPGLKTFLRRQVLRYVYRFVDTAFYVGQNNRAYYRKHGLQEGQLVFVPHAIDNDRFADSSGAYADKARQWRKELGIATNQVVVLFVGKFEAKKHPQLLLVLNKDEQIRKQCSILFVGNGEHEEALKSKSQAMDNVYFLPFQNQSAMPAVYRLADIFILPSVGPGETWGLAVNEAMACALPVLVSDRCGCALDLVKGGLNGYCFEAGNIGEALAKLKHLLVADCPQMGKKGRELIEAWSFDAICQNVYRHLSRISS